MCCCNSSAADRRAAAARNRAAAQVGVAAIQPCAQALPTLADQALDARTVVVVYMGQGVVGDARHAWLTSVGFSTCSPVVLWNDDTKMAGLFHYPAKSLGEEEAVLEAMLAEVKPTHIRVGLGGHHRSPDMGAIGGKAEMETDQEDVAAFFRKKATGAQVIKEQEGHGYRGVTAAQGTGEITLNDQNPTTYGGPVASMREPPGRLPAGFRVYQRRNWEFDRIVHGDD